MAVRRLRLRPGENVETRQFQTRSMMVSVLPFANELACANRDGSGLAGRMAAWKLKGNKLLAKRNLLPLGSQPAMSSA